MNVSSGLINILKPPGMTSHDVVACVRRIIGIKKCGHSGTLDPAAVGVLPVFFGDGTRLIEYYQHLPKTYIAEIIFGIETDTYDYTGSVTTRKQNYSFTREALAQVCQSFEGHIQQLPPMYSAVKVNGKKLYQLARQGIDIERVPRNIEIKRIKIKNLQTNSQKIIRAVLEVECSAGTYIRSLCFDIGRSLKCGATMGFLIRNQSNGLHISNSVLLDELKDNPGDYILPAWAGLSTMPSLEIQREDQIKFCHGQTIRLDSINPGVNYLVLSESKEVLGVGKSEKFWLSPTKVFVKNEVNHGVQL